MAETSVKGPSGGGTSSAEIGVTTQLDAGLSAWREGVDDSLGARCGLPSSSAEAGPQRREGGLPRRGSMLRVWRIIMRKVDYLCR